MFNFVYVHQDTIGLSKFLSEEGYQIRDSIQPETIKIYCGDSLPKKEFHIWIKNSSGSWNEELKNAVKCIKENNILFVIISSVVNPLCKSHEAIISDNGVHIFSNQYDLRRYLLAIMDTIHG